MYNTHILGVLYSQDLFPQVLEVIKCWLRSYGVHQSKTLAILHVQVPHGRELLLQIKNRGEEPSAARSLIFHLHLAPVWLTVPAVSRISSIHCCPSTSTCCWRKKEIKRAHFSYKKPWGISTANHRAALGSVFLSRPFCTSLLLLGRTSPQKFLAQIGPSEMDKWNGGKKKSGQYIINNEKLALADLFPTKIKTLQFININVHSTLIS